MFAGGLGLGPGAGATIIYPAGLQVVTLDSGALDVTLAAGAGLTVDVPAAAPLDVDLGGGPLIVDLDEDEGLVIG